MGILGHIKVLDSLYKSIAQLYKPPANMVALGSHLCYSLESPNTFVEGVWVLLGHSLMTYMVLTTRNIQSCLTVSLRWTPHPVIVAIRDIRTILGSSSVPIIPLLQGGASS